MLPTAPHDITCTASPSRHASSSSRALLIGIKGDEDDEHVRYVESRVGTVRRLSKIPREIVICHEKMRALFEMWKREYDVSYPSSLEEERRLGGFKECVARIHRHNSQPGVTYVKGINQFADRLPSDPWIGARMTLEEGLKIPPQREGVKRYLRGRNLRMRECR